MSFDTFFVSVTSGLRRTKKPDPEISWRYTIRVKGAHALTASQTGVARIEGVLHTMTMTKVKLATVLVLAAATLEAGRGQYLASSPAPPQKKDDKETLQDKIDKLEKQLRDAKLAEEQLRKSLDEARRQAEVALARAEVALLEAQLQRDRAEQALAKGKPSPSVAAVLPGKLKVSLADNGAVSAKAKRLAVTLTFSNNAPEEGRFMLGDIHIFLLDKNGERVTAEVRVYDPDKKVFRVQGGKGQTTVLALDVTLDPVLRPGEDYGLVVIIVNQAGMVRFSTKE
jgi:hypothetical protein